MIPGKKQRDVYRLPKSELARHGVNPIRTVSELWMSPLFTEYVQELAGKPVDLKTLQVIVPEGFPMLDGTDVDVLAQIVSAWLEMYRSTGQTVGVLEYASTDAIREMGWPYDGRSKKRYEKALSKLADIRFEVSFRTSPTLFNEAGQPVAQLTEEHWEKVALFPKVHVAHTYVTTPDKGRQKKPGRRKKSLGCDVRITISEDFAWFASRGTFKLMHPYLYVSRGSWGKQLFALLTSIASKRDDYLLPESDLRDYFGAPVQKLYWSHLIQRLQPHLQRMKDDGVIVNWISGRSGEVVHLSNERHPRTMRENYLRVWPNRRGYFFAKLDPGALPEPHEEVQVELPFTLSEIPTPAALIERMLEHGFRPRRTAAEFVTKLGVEKMTEVLDQLEHALKNGLARNAGGYLRALMTGDMPPPAGWRPKAEREEEERRVARTLEHSEHCDQARTALQFGDLERAERELSAAETLYVSRASRSLRAELRASASSVSQPPAGAAMTAATTEEENVDIVYSWAARPLPLRAQQTSAARWVESLSEGEKEELFAKYLGAQGFSVSGASWEVVRKNRDAHLARMYEQPEAYGLDISAYGNGEPA